MTYFLCHELRYEDFGSVQALLESMREYQRIALEKSNLESILWNKVRSRYPTHSREKLEN